MTPAAPLQAVLQTEKEAAAKPGEAGDAHYAVSGKWFSQWCQYSGFEYDPSRKKARLVVQQQPGPRPGPIDNSDLLSDPPVRLVPCCVALCAVGWPAVVATLLLPRCRCCCCRRPPLLGAGCIFRPAPAP